jgi:hypothetical protein
VAAGEPSAFDREPGFSADSPVTDRTEAVGWPAVEQGYGADGASGGALMKTLAPAPPTG